MNKSRQAMLPLVVNIVLFLSLSCIVSSGPTKPRSLSFITFKPSDHNISQLTPILKKGFFHSLSWQRTSYPSEKRYLPTSLPSTTSNRGEKSSNSSSPSRKQNTKYSVLYQKVLRAPSSQSSSVSPQYVSGTFLLDLVIFLQNMFEVPDGLPMPYEIIITDHDEEESTDSRAVLTIDSPLSSNPCDTCLEVEVVGIFPDSGDTSQGTSNTARLAPTMAMVVVKKNGSPFTAKSATGGLFEASEKRIIQSLDRGLQQFEEGRISIPSHLRDDPIDDFDEIVKDDDDDGEVGKTVKRLAYSNTINAAKIDSTGFEMRVDQKPINIERDGMGNTVIDSVSKPEPFKEKFMNTPKPRTSSGIYKKYLKYNSSRPLKVSAIDSTKGDASSQSKIPNETTKPQKMKAMAQPKRSKQLESEDYAIQMARKQAESLMKTAKIGKITSSSKGTIAISGGEGDFAIMAARRAIAHSKRIEQMSTKGQESIVSDIREEKRMHDTKTSDPSQDELFIKLQNSAKSAKRKAWNTKIFTKGSILSSNDPNIGVVPIKTLKTGPVSKDDGADEKSSLSPRPDSSTLRTGKTDEEIEDDIMKIAKENEEIKRDLLKAAMDMMPVEKEGEEGLSPEELLAQVLKFGDEKKKEKSPGYGFVEGAFGKAKELLRENGRLSNVKFKEFDGNPFEGMKYEGNDLTEELDRKTEEEELRKIFTKGRSEALERSSSPSTQSSLTKSTITDEDINALIAADDTIPRNARILDDEFVELELRISRSEGENSGDPTKNKVFDVFSGPETYNPNVDPETAVNWPGAKEGTRTDVRLASELSTALKQAQFAAAVLSKMRTEEGVNKTKYYVGESELSQERVNLLQMCVDEAVKAGLIEDPQIKLFERSRLQMLIDELTSQPDERFEEISLEYKDLLLSDNLVELFKERLHTMAKCDMEEARLEGSEDSLKELHAKERIIMMNLAQLAQGLVKEAQALGAELEVSMLEIIRSICEVAMDPSHKSQEDTAIALTDAVRDMRPLLDDAFVAYLKYAIAEEEGKLAREGVLDDPEYNRWLFVLKIVQEGVYAELSRGVKRYVDHIWYVLRMNSKSERKELLKKLIEVMPTMDVRPFVKVVNNIVSSLGTTVKGDFADGVILGEMTNKLLQLQRDVGDLLPPERIKELSKDADDWAAAQRKRLLERQKLTRQRLKAARQTGTVDPDSVLKQPGIEAERFD
mmetsp:Transcript_18194/g.37666  ORF Transcript_18194/g.37666 Transcript_18194/m.37666 type:complete len:1207 (+) Transcript_18194:108-3728(+)